jgi:hypothetical protein
MEKAKRKHSPEIAQKQITRILLLILGLSILIFFFPLAWLKSPIKPPLQTYTLLPLLSIPLAMVYGSRFGLRKRDFVLVGLSLFMAWLIFMNFAVLGCGNDSWGGILIANAPCDWYWSLF